MDLVNGRPTETVTLEGLGVSYFDTHLTDETAQ